MYDKLDWKIKLTKLWRQIKGVTKGIVHTGAKKPSYTTVYHLAIWFEFPAFIVPCL
jgi:hypothetical protein